jgi:hypothetical protein
MTCGIVPTRRAQRSRVNGDCRSRESDDNAFHTCFLTVTSRRIVGVESEGRPPELTNPPPNSRWIVELDRLDLTRPVDAAAAVDAHGAGFPPERLGEGIPTAPMPLDINVSAPARFFIPRPSQTVMERHCGHRRRGALQRASGTTFDLSNVRSLVSRGTLWTTLVAAINSSAGSPRTSRRVLAWAISRVKGQT